MNFIVAYFKGFWQMLKSGKIVLVHYLALLILALVSALPFMDLMEAKVGHSLAFEKLLSDFDYTVYQDFRNLPGVEDALSAIGNTSQWLLLLFFILSAFLTGGVLKVYKNAPDKFTLQSFFSGCTYYFWRMLRMSLYFLVVHVAVIALFAFIYQQLTKGGFEVLGTEVGYLKILRNVAIPYLFVGAWFFMTHDYAKIHMVHRDKGFIFKSFWQSFPLVFRNFFNTYLLYILNALTFAGVFVLYLYLSQFIIADTPQGIGLAFLLGQAFIVARIAVRLLNLASATLVYKGIMKKRQTKELKASEAEAARLQAIADAEAEAAQAATIAKEAEQNANIASQKASLAQQTAAAIALGTVNNTGAEVSTSSKIEPVIEATDFVEKRDHTEVVKPPTIAKDLIDEEE